MPRVMLAIAIPAFSNLSMSSSWLSKRPQRRFCDLYIRYVSSILPCCVAISIDVFLKPPENAALRTVVDLGIFPLLVKAGAESGISASDLAKSTGADRGLIGKF